MGGDLAIRRRMGLELTTMVRPSPLNIIRRLLTRPKACRYGRVITPATYAWLKGIQAGATRLFKMTTVQESSTTKHRGKSPQG